MTSNTNRVINARMIISWAFSLNGKILNIFIHIYFDYNPYINAFEKEACAFAKIFFE